MSALDLFVAWRGLAAFFAAGFRFPGLQQLTLRSSLAPPPTLCVGFAVRSGRIQNWLRIGRRSPSPAANARRCVCDFS